MDVDAGVGEAADVVEEDAAADAAADAALTRDPLLLWRKLANSCVSEDRVCGAEGQTSCLASLPYPHLSPPFHPFPIPFPTNQIRARTSL